MYNYPTDEDYARKNLLERKKKHLPPPTEEEMDMDFNLARSCLHIFLYQQVNWRFCHRDKEMILKLKNIITFGVLKTVPGIEIDELISNFNI